MKQFAALIAASLCCGGCVESHGLSYEFLYSIDAAGSGMEVLSPNAFTLDASDRVILPRGADATIGVYGANGVPLFQFGSLGLGPGEFVAPRGVAVADNGRIFVADHNSSRIEVFNSAGVFQSLLPIAVGAGLGQMYLPLGMDIYSDLLFVTDAGNGRIQVFDQSGTYVRTMGSLGSGLGQLLGPFDVKVSSAGEVFVPDHLTHSVSVYDADSGAFLRRFGDFGTGVGQFRTPSGVAFDPQGNIWVVDAGNDRVQAFNSDGSVIGSLGVSGSGPGEFNGPIDIEFGQSGLMFVSDQSNNRIQVFARVNSVPDALPTTCAILFSSMLLLSAFGPCRGCHARR